MPRPKSSSRAIIESYYRAPIRWLFHNSSGLPDKPTEHVIGPARLIVRTLPDNNGIIEIGDRRWAVQYHPRSNWLNAHDEYCADYWVIGRNGKRHRDLLVAPDGSHVGTISELGAHYWSSHIFSPTRVIRRRRKILQELGLTADAGNMNLHYLPLTD